MDDEDELLDPGSPALPRPARIAALVLTVAALAALFAIRLWPDSGAKAHQAALGTAPPPPINTLFPLPTGVPHTWPTARNGCGGETEVPIVSSQPPTERTGLRLLLGGNELRTVNFDTGRVTPLPVAQRGRQTFVATLSATLPGYATTETCGIGGRSRILRVGTDRTVQDLGKLSPDQFVLADGNKAWRATGPHGRRHPHGSITPLGIGPRVRLPAHAVPEAIEQGTLVASRQVSEDGDITLLLLDPAIGHVASSVDADYPIALGAGRVLWTTGCDPDRDGPCLMDVLRLKDGSSRLYQLPRPPLAGTLSPNGMQVALVLEATETNPYNDQHPFPPSNIAVLDLRTGGLHLVPGVTLPAKVSPGLAFSPDGRWLAIALDAGTKTRLLAWRPGMGHRHPFEIAPVLGPNYGSPPLIAVGG